ncbi:MAG: hypothetical protein K2X77_24980 [Candidatus Obscuribacterales bacterium]|nr:hypothetical protein [Candidatus Obscuribacterales bacterium]
MNTNPQNSNNDKNGINLEVFFPAVPRPYTDQHVSPSETIGQLLQKVLRAFELTNEGSEYSLRYENTILANLSETLATIAQGRHNLKLTLAKQIISGGGKT